MKTKNKLLILFISIISILFIQVVMIIPFSVAEVNVETSTIQANWMYVSVGEFQDNSYVAGENKLKISSGGSDLISFTNLGMVAISDTEILYKGSAVFGYEISAHSAVGFRDLYPNINREVMESYPFFKITKQSAFLSPKTYSVSYYNIEKGNLREHSYEGYIPVTIGMRDTTSMQNNIQLNGITFQMPEYAVDIMGVRVVELRDGEVGLYNDEFEDLSGIEEGTVNLQEFSNYNLDAADREIVNFINGYNLGFDIGEVQSGQTLQQKILDGSQGGVEWHNPSPARDKTFDFQLYGFIQPQAFEYIQYNTVRYAAINYDDWGLNVGHIDIVEGPSVFMTPKRTVGIHTNNYFLKWDLEFEVDFYATIPSTAELSEKVLDDPYLKKGDFIWDVSVTGDYKVDVPLTWSSFEEWIDELFGLFGGIFGFIIFIVVVIAGIYIFIQVGIPLIVRKLNKKAKSENVQKKLKY